MRQVRDALAETLRQAGGLAAPGRDGRAGGGGEGPRDRGVVHEVEHREAGRSPQAVSPFRFSLTPTNDVRPAPLLGEHTFEVLSELLGTTKEEYEALVAAGVSGTEKPR